MAILRRAFNLGRTTDPPMVVRQIRIPRLAEHNVREGFIEHETYVNLRDALPRHLKAIFVVAYHVGARFGELGNLQWHQLDLNAGEIRLPAPQTKDKRPRTLPIYGEMGPWLEMQKTERDQKSPNCPWVFFYRGRRIGRHMKGWKQACQAAGAPGLLFHDLRRSAVRNMECAGIPRKVAMEISGHKTEAVYRRYDIISPQDLRTAAVRMETYLGTLLGTPPTPPEKTSSVDVRKLLT